MHWGPQWYFDIVNKYDVDTHHTGVLKNMLADEIDISDVSIQRFSDRLRFSFLNHRIHALTVHNSEPRDVA